MKNLIFIVIALVLLTSCSGKHNSRKITGDTTTAMVASQDASTPHPESPATESAPNSQDSSAEKKAEKKEDSKKIYAALPNYKEFFSEGGYGYLDKYLKSLGYKGTTKIVQTIDGPELHGNFKFEDGEKSITIKYRELLGIMESKITIIGDEKALLDFYKKAKKLQGNEDWWNCKVYKKGNTVFIEGGMC